MNIEKTGMQCVCENGHDGGMNVMWCSFDRTRAETKRKNLMSKHKREIKSLPSDLQRIASFDEGDVRVIELPVSSGANPRKVRDGHVVWVAEAWDHEGATVHGDGGDFLYIGFRRSDALAAISRDKKQSRIAEKRDRRDFDWHDKWSLRRVPVEVDAHADGHWFRLEA